MDIKINQIKLRKNLETKWSSVSDPGSVKAVTIAPDHDSYVYSDSPDTNYGSAMSLLIWITSGGDWQMPFLHFPTASIPSSNIITLAILYLNYYIWSFTVTWNPVYRNDQSFNENTITWNNKPGKIGDSLGNLCAYSVDDRWASVDITETFKGWHNGAINNYGIQIEPEDTTWQQNGGYVSKDHPEYHSLKPYILVQYY